jgi:hypothetical protein
VKKNQARLCFAKIGRACFDLWMSKGANNIFALVINFLKLD